MEDAHASREQRKTVTVLFCDVTGSTALGESTDPEALRALLARYFERMKGIVESHGGTVEKFIGDAVMAVFGVPQLHEDDALRACRAAVEMRDALPELGVQARIGVNTGEVVTGTEERLATGDAVNVAARLEQAAQPGEILIGAETLALVSDAAEIEAVEPLELKGKAERVAAYRLAAVREEVERRHASAFVGREPELETLLESWQRARDEERCALVTIVGRPGCGQVAPRGRIPRADGRDDRPRPLPLLRGGHHLLAGGRGAQAAGRFPFGSRCGGAASLAARRDARGRPPPTRSRGRSASSSRSRRASGPSSASLTTSSGERRRSSTWSSRSRCSRPARRSSSFAWRGRSSRSAARSGRSICGSSRFRSPTSMR